jgi:membrane protein DedA with SNARE-associated domain
VPQWLLDLFARYGYAVIFFGVMLENAGVPIPGETTLLAAGALAHLGRLSLPWVMACAVVGAVVGDNVGFAIGRKGGRRLIDRYGHRMGLSASRLRQFDAFFDKYGAATVFIARFVTGLRVFCAVLAGGSGLRWRTFLFYNASGAIVWSVTIAMVGYSLAYSWSTLERWIGRSGLIALAIVALIALVAYLRRDTQTSS